MPQILIILQVLNIQIVSTWRT